MKINVDKTGSSGGLYEFDIAVDEYDYKVRLSDDYYRKLTGGKVTPSELVHRSFEFLLQRESASAILSRFELPVINEYFPEYEREMMARITGQSE